MCCKKIRINPAVGCLHRKQIDDTARGNTNLSEELHEADDYGRLRARGRLDASLSQITIV